MRVPTATGWNSSGRQCRPDAVCQASTCHFVLDNVTRQEFVASHRLLSRVCQSRGAASNKHRLTFRWFILVLSKNGQGQAQERGGCGERRGEYAKSRPLARRPTAPCSPNPTPGHSQWSLGALCVIYTCVSCFGSLALFDVPFGLGEPSRRAPSSPGNSSSCGAAIA